MKFMPVLIFLSLGSCAIGHKPITTNEAYVKALNKHVSRKFEWGRDISEAYDCMVNVRQDLTGNVVSVEFLACSEDDSLIDSIERAINDASPLPLPDDMSLFEDDLAFRFCRLCQL